MKYEQRYPGSDEGRVISYEKALDIVLGTYKDNEATRAMLTIGNRIQCQFSTITVYNDEGLTAAPGLYNLLPDDFVYV